MTACGLFFFFLIFRKAKLVGDEKHKNLKKKRSALTGFRATWKHLYRYMPGVCVRACVRVCVAVA